MLLPNLFGKPLFFLGLQKFFKPGSEPLVIQCFPNLMVHLVAQAKARCTRLLSKWKVSSCPGEPSRRPAGSSDLMKNHLFLIEPKKMPNQDWHILKHFQKTCINNPWTVTYHLLNTRNQLSLTGMCWNFVCAVFNTIPYTLCAYHHPYQIQDFSPVSPLKIFSTICSPQYCFSHLLPDRTNFPSLFHFTAFLSCFDPELFFLLPFLCSLSFSFYSWNKAGICFTVSFSSTPHQLFSLSLPLFYHLLSTVSPSYSTSLTW